MKTSTIIWLSVGVAVGITAGIIIYRKVRKHAIAKGNLNIKFVRADGNED